jgi:hypothetical protein
MCGVSVRGLPHLFPLPLALLAFSLAPGDARAQDARGPERPRIQVAVGLGLSVDRNEPNPTPDRPIPSFFFALGLGDGPFGLELRSFANGATMTQVTRLAVELTVVARPLSLFHPDRLDYGHRVLRALAVDVGPAFERVSLSVDTRNRLGVVVGGHLDLPLGPPNAPRELRLRLGVRHLLAGRATLGDLSVGDSQLEVYGQVAFVL